VVTGFLLFVSVVALMPALLGFVNREREKQDAMADTCSETAPVNCESELRNVSNMFGSFKEIGECLFRFFCMFDPAFLLLLYSFEAMFLAVCNGNQKDAEKLQKNALKTVNRLWTRVPDTIRSVVVPNPSAPSQKDVSGPAQQQEPTNRFYPQDVSQKKTPSKKAEPRRFIPASSNGFLPDLGD